MFVQSVEFIRAHAKGNGNGGRAKADIAIYGQESNYTTWRLAVERSRGWAIETSSTWMPALTPAR